MENDLISRSALLKLFDERMDRAHIQVATRRTGKTLWCGIHTGVNWGRNVVIEAHAVDAVEVVRCKNCKHWHEEAGWCDHHSHFIMPDGEACHPWESSEWKMFDGNDFCSHGKRRADDGK